MWHHDVSIRELLGNLYPDFDVMWDFTDRIPGSFTRLNAAVLYRWASLSSMQNIVEIGVDQGRSASILLHCSEKTGNAVYLIDKWGGILEANRQKTMEMTRHFPRAVFDVIAQKSEEAAAIFHHPIHMLHIDAHHYEGGVDVDCRWWLPKLVSGGVVLFHDYGTTFDAVTKAVDEFTEGWEDLGSWDSLAVRRKP